jgi:hypothetical protein
MPIISTDDSTIIGSMLVHGTDAMQCSDRGTESGDGLHETE